ncbi:hypothetical protein BB560_001883 [Smittium megazygosporum]|uniref:Prokaryotic-type class I peptide chain release factors domain-containing protein n=1 Tax=Smittium megazygosporum TaxID=133381 RepID=A0A2T9ZGC3_9FUNG|nr:hypothetical protein BB560_001883 [Smittium megazygosporum]
MISYSNAVNSKTSSKEPLSDKEISSELEDMLKGVDFVDSLIQNKHSIRPKQVLEIDDFEEEVPVETPGLEPENKKNKEKDQVKEELLEEYKKTLVCKGGIYIINLLEKDFAESFIKGSGNGGQAVNKTNNNVNLKHLPTGITVQCHATRSLVVNRKFARKRIKEILDNLVNKNSSKAAIKQAKIKEAKRKKRQKTKAKYHSKGSKNSIENEVAAEE